LGKKRPMGKGSLKKTLRGTNRLKRGSEKTENGRGKGQESGEKEGTESILPKINHQRQEKKKTKRTG